MSQRVQEFEREETPRLPSPSSPKIMEVVVGRCGRKIQMQCAGMWQVG